MRALLVLALCLAAVAAVPKTQQRIVGGSVTTISQWPSITSLLYSRYQISYWQACGGSIINQRTILTAAHCTSGDSAGQWRVRVGSTWANSGGVVHSCSQIINHPNFSWSTLNNDVSILRTASNIVYSNDVRAAFIASATYVLADNQPVWAAGWGATSFNGPASEQLRHVQVYTVNQAVCVANYRSIGLTVNDNMLCAGILATGGRDACQGDSGGPLYHNGVVVGVCSWGHECARANFPGVNARVSRYAAWISANA